MNPIKETYQGWTNWDTWNCHFWLTNCEPLERALRRCCFAYQVEELWLTYYIDGHDGIDTSEVNFDEILKEACDEDDCADERGFED